MGKSGNQRRKEKRKENTRTLLDKMNVANEEIEEAILGARGVPKEDNVILLPAPQQRQPTLLDALGRKIEDRIPNNIRANPKEEDVSPKAGTLSGSHTKERKVMLVRDHALNYPELWMDVFIAGDPAVSNDVARFAKMFVRAECHGAASVDDADLVVFGGGSDVNPALYGEEPHPSVHWNDERDTADMKLYLECLEKGVPMLGVCRGAQFLHVMNGGKLIQHLDNHHGDHKIYDVHGRAWIDKVSSVHHQAVRPDSSLGITLLATSNKSDVRWYNDKDKDPRDGPSMDVEAFLYRDTCCIGVQGHPEYVGYPFYTAWCLGLLMEHVVCSPDIELQTTASGAQVRRLKKSVIENRKEVIHIASQTKG